MIHNAILEAYRSFEEHSWNKIYVALDIHGTVAMADYKSASTCLYDACVPALQEISSYAEVSIILFSCCHPPDFPKYFKLFRDNNIQVDFFNCNPEVPNTETGCFDSKFYYNVIFEDKAGFRPYMWPQVLTTFRQARQFNKRIQELKEKVW